MTFPYPADARAHHRNALGVGKRAEAEAATGRKRRRWGRGRGRPTVKNRKAWGSPRRARRGKKGSEMGCHTTTVSCTTIDYRGPNASFGPPGIRGCQRPSHELPKFPFNFGPFWVKFGLCDTDVPSGPHATIKLMRF